MNNYLTGERIILDDGTSLPNPVFSGITTAIYKCRHSEKELTKYEKLLLASFCDAYIMIACHPSGPVSFIKKIEELKTKIGKTQNE